MSANNKNNQYPLKTLKAVKTPPKTQTPIIPIAQYRCDFYLNPIHSSELNYSNCVTTLKALLRKEEERRNEVLMIAIPVGFREQAIQAIERVLSNEITNK